MKLENQVCTLEQAKRLKELGINQRSHFYHANEYEHRLCTDYLNGFLFVNDYGEVAYLNREAVVFSAFTVAELGVMLPPDKCATVTRAYDSHSISCTWWKHSKNVGDWSDNSHESMQSYEDTESKCRAEVLIYLLENKHITPEEVNERLKNS